MDGGIKIPNLYSSNIDGINMIASPQNTYLTPEEYLQTEENSPIKHEYIDGHIYAMADALDPHVTIASNLFALCQ